MSGIMLMMVGGAGDIKIDLANSTNVNLLSLYTSAYGSPTSSVRAKFVIPAGITIGGVGTTALIVGQFPSGSNLTIDIQGNIQGYGGAAGTSGFGGAGGDCINANYPNQTVVINNFGSVWAGGGGGGKGGTGGQGSYAYYAGQYVWSPPNAGSTCNASCAAAPQAAGYAYVQCASGCNQLTIDEWGNTAWFCPTCNGYNYAISSGGAGGNGGQGQGYGQGYTGGAAGGAGGTNAGVGGSGGSGAGWGSGGGGGQTGASGNYTAGSSGWSGGNPGKYLVKGASAVTFNNFGSIAGALA